MSEPLWALTYSGRCVVTQARGKEDPKRAAIERAYCWVLGLDAEKWSHWWLFTFLRGPAPSSSWLLQSLIWLRRARIHRPFWTGNFPGLMGIKTHVTHSVICIIEFILLARTRLSIVIATLWWVCPDFIIPKIEFESTINVLSIIVSWRWKDLLGPPVAPPPSPHPHNQNRKLPAIYLLVLWLGFV